MMSNSICRCYHVLFPLMMLHVKITIFYYRLLSLSIIVDVSHGNSTDESIHKCTLVFMQSGCIFCQILINSIFLNRSSKSPHFANICLAGRTTRRSQQQLFATLQPHLKHALLLILLLLS